MENLVTRFDEVRLRVSDPRQMLGKTLAEDVCRKWKEDFVDQSTGKVIPVERNEFILKRGTQLSNEDVSKIQFHIQSGDIKDVLVSNQYRSGQYSMELGPFYYEVNISSSDGKSRILTYAQGIPMALQMAIDYAEQTHNGGIHVNSVKLTYDYQVLNYTPSSGEEEQWYKYYVVTIAYYDGRADQMVDVVFLAKAKDADMAIDVMRSYIASNEFLLQRYGQYVIKSAKESSINEIVPTKFCEKYIKEANLTDYLLNGQRIGQHSA